MGTLSEMVAWLVPTGAALLGVDLTKSATFNVFARAKGRFSLRVRGGPQTVDVVVAEAGEFGEYHLFLARACLEGLSPDTVYDVELWQGDYPVDRCTLRTFPSQLGTEHAPFRLFLGSCYAFHSTSDGGNDLTKLVSVLRDRGRMPHAKVLCGDQVYLDIPVIERVPSDVNALRGMLAKKYLENWQPHREDARRTFGEFLRAGSNLFVTDDHEFWNNYPWPPSYKPGLWEPSTAHAYAVAAEELARIFQNVPPSLRTMRVGQGKQSLSIALLDGRVARSQTRTTAHAPEDLRLLATYLREAEGPCVVVLSQPLFEPAVGPFKRAVADRGLADLADYPALVDALYDCPHDVVVLSGDIHAGRLMSTYRLPRAGLRDQRLIEVVSSPLALVRGGSYTNSVPRVFPDEGEGARRGSYGPLERHFGPVRMNHGAMLEFWAYRETVGLSVSFLSTRTGTSLGSGQRPFQLA